MEALLEGAAAFVTFGDWGVAVVCVDVGSCSCGGGWGCVCVCVCVCRWWARGLTSSMGVDWREGMHCSGSRGR